MNNKAILELLSFTDNPMDIYSIDNESSLLYRIEDIERLVRSSREYKGWVVWKKYRHSQTICKELNIDISEYDGVYIEQDHFPITIFDIVLVVGLKMISKLKQDEFLTIFDIASEVIKDHLDEDNLIATVSLTTTHHQLRHNGVHSLKLNDINGNYEMFLDKYKNYVPVAVAERIDFNLKSLV